MPITRDSLMKNAKRTKIVDDPNNPGNPLDMAPAQARRLQHEVDALLKKAKVVGLGHDLAETNYAQAVSDTLEWLLDVSKPSPL